MHLRQLLSSANKTRHLVVVCVGGLAAAATQSLAVLGIGSSPGKTNLMAAHAVRELGEQPAAIDVAAAGRDFGLDADDRLRPPYALRTLLDELTMEPVVIVP